MFLSAKYVFTVIYSRKLGVCKFINLSLNINERILRRDGYVYFLIQYPIFRRLFIGEKNYLGKNNLKKLFGESKWVGAN